jgi:hypothetical protein
MSGKSILQVLVVLFLIATPVCAEFHGMSDWDVLVEGPDGTVGNPSVVQIDGNPPYPFRGFTFIDANIPLDDIVVAEEITMQEISIDPGLHDNPGDVQDFDLESGLPRSGQSDPKMYVRNWDGSPTWQDTNGDLYDFFLFEYGRNDEFTVQAILPGPGGSEVLGEPVVVPASTWLPSVAGEPDIALSGVSFNGGQTLGGIAFKVTDLKDQNGNPLTNESVILGLLYINGGMDPSGFFAVKGVPEGPESAHDPSPIDTALMVPVDVILGWSPGADATQHTVYLSTNQDDVANDVGGVTVSETSYDPGGLQNGTTYYWRVDASDGTNVVKGDIWSFTTEPAGQGGLNGEYIQGADNLAGDPTLTRVDPVIDFDWSTDSPDASIDRAAFTARWRGVLSIPATDTYTIIANSNDGVRVFLDGAQIIEDWSNHTARDATATLELEEGAYSIRIEYYQDGGDAQLHLLWRSSRIEQQIIPSVMLNSILRAEVISPANGAGEVSQSPRLMWIPISSSAGHDVYVGTDAEAVEAADTSTADIYKGRQFDTSYLLEGLGLNMTYYWRIDEVVGGNITKGIVWSFTTSEAVVVDDFENYTDEMPNELWRTWIDGIGFEEPAPGNPGNGTGAEVGNWPPPIAELNIVHGGRQSMPFVYNNTESPFLSEAQRDLGTPQDWTQAFGRTLTSLQLWYRANTPPGEFNYDSGTGTYTIGGFGEGIEGASDSFRFVYKQITGDGTITARLTQITRFSDDTHSGIMFRESPDPGSVMVMNTMRAAGQVFVRSRVTADDAVQDGPQVPQFPATLVIPHWMRLKREGNVFTAEHSSDGQTWEVVGDPVTVPMAQTVYVGMAVAAVQPEDSLLVNTSVFKDLSIDGTVDQTGPLEKVLDIGMPTNSSEEMYLIIEDNTGNSAVVTNPEGNIATRASNWTPWQVVLSEVADQGVDLTKVQSLKIGVGNKLAPSAGGTGKMFIDDIRLYPSPLAHHWTLDEDTAAGATIAADSVGGKDGVIIGAVTSAGVFGNALYFDGTSNVEVADFSTADLKRITVTFWMNPDVGFTTTGSYKRVISAGDNWEVVMEPDSGLLGNNFYQSGGTYPKSTVVPTEGEWTFVGMTSVLGTAGNPGRMEIYINGELDVSADNADDDWAGGTVLFAHRPGRGDNERYKGLMDDIRIYKDVLSQAEIESVMNGK